MTSSAPSELSRAYAYERFVRIEFLVVRARPVAVLAAYAKWGGRFVRESAAGRIGTGMLLAMLGFALLWLTLLPAGLFDLWWQRRHDLTESGYVEFFFESWFGLGGEFLFLCLAIVIVMGLAGVFPNYWWIPAPACSSRSYARSHSSTRTSREAPTSTTRTRRRRARLCGRPGDRRHPDRVVDVSAFTTAPNAEAAGYGPSRKIILWSTLLDGRFDDNWCASWSRTRSATMPATTS